MKRIWICAMALAVMCMLPPAMLAADDAAAKPGEAVNGLKAEVTVVNAPIYPGDDLQLDLRLTNTQKEGDIQIVDDSIFWFYYGLTCTGPDGKQIMWPQPKIMMKQPEAPTATIPPGGFYGRKVALGAAQLSKPGKYTISIRYSNGEAIKDKGFNCWTGNVESSTATFEVPDFSNVAADASGMKMFIKMNKQYGEKEPVTITVYLYNSSDTEKEITPLSEHFMWLTNGQLKDEKGEVALSYNPDFVDKPRAPVKIASHKAITNEYDLHTAYNKLPVGKYTYQLHSSDPGMISNEVAFEILPAEKPAEPGKEPDAPVNDGAQLLLKMAQEKYADKAPIKLTVTIKNVGEAEKEVYTLDDEFLSYYCAGSVLKNADGKQMPWTIKMYPVKEPPFKTEKLAPGGKIAKEYDLRTVADLPPGKYTMQMRPHLPVLGDMVSNEVTFEILPAEKSPAEAPPAQMELMIEMEKEKYSSNESIAFRVILKNTGKDKMTINRLLGDELFNESTGELKGADGKPLSWKASTSYTRLKFSLDPDETYTSGWIDLRDATKIPPGQYSFKLIGKDDWYIGDFESNEVKFTVEAPEEPQPAP